MMRSMRARLCFAVVMLQAVEAVVSPARAALLTKGVVGEAAARSSLPLKMYDGHGWVTTFDQSSGDGYYDQQQRYNGQVLWNLVGNSGVRGFSIAFSGARSGYYQQDYRFLPYALRNGEEQVLSRWNMVRQKPTVSRMQCVIQVSLDGVATLTSCGRGPTLWRQHGGGWVALYNGDYVSLSEGDQVGLDWHDPEAAVFTCYPVAEDNMRYNQYGQQQQPPQAPHGDYSAYHQDSYDGQHYYAQQQQQGGYYPDPSQEEYDDGQYYGHQEQGGYSYMQ